MKVQQTLAQTWKRRRDSDHATAKRLIEERGVGVLGVPNELLPCDRAPGLAWSYGSALV